MVAAVQPFISGAISKTFNMPSDTTVEEITEAFMLGWKLGLKAFAVYRDGSKSAQPLFTNATHKSKGAEQENRPVRRRLPSTRVSETHKFSIVGHDGYLTYSAFEDGSPAELFVTMSKQGSTLSGLLDAFSISVSIALQHGVPLYALASKFCYARFEPSGYTENPDIQIATSITDYIFRYLSLRFLDPEELSDLGVHAPVRERAPMDEALLLKAVEDNPVGVHYQKGGEASGGATVTVSKPKASVETGVFCKACGGMMVQTGTCKTCLQCGSSNGGC